MGALSVQARSRWANHEIKGNKPSNLLRKRQTRQGPFELAEPQCVKRSYITSRVIKSEPVTIKSAERAGLNTSNRTDVLEGKKRRKTSSRRMQMGIQVRNAFRQRDPHVPGQHQRTRYVVCFEKIFLGWLNVSTRAFFSPLLSCRERERVRKKKKLKWHRRMKKMEGDGRAVRRRWERLERERESLGWCFFRWFGSGDDESRWRLEITQCLSGRFAKPSE